MSISLTEAVRAAIESRLSEVHTMIPGVVKTFDPNKLSVDVQPSIKRVFADGEILSLPIITAVPVIYPRTKKSILYFPLEAGDAGAIFFCERSLDIWLSKGGEVDPKDNRKFHFADAIFIPGLFSFAQDNPATGNEEDFVAIHNDQKITIKKNGDIEVGSSSLKALVNEEFKTLFNSHTHPYTTGALTSPSGTVTAIAPTVCVGAPNESMTNSHLTTKVKAQ